MIKSELLRICLESAYFVENTVDKGKSQLKQYSETCEQY